MPASLKWGLQSKEKPHAWHKTRHRAGNHYEKKKALFIESTVCLEERVVVNERIQLMVFLSPLLSLHDMSIEKSVGSVKIHESLLIDVVANDSNDNTHE